MPDDAGMATLFYQNPAINFDHPPWSKDARTTIHPNPLQGGCMSFDRKLWLEFVIESETLTRDQKLSIVCVCQHLRDITQFAEARRILTRFLGAELADETLRDCAGG